MKTSATKTIRLLVAAAAFSMALACQADTEIGHTTPEDGSRFGTSDWSYTSYTVGSGIGIGYQDYATGGNPTYYQQDTITVNPLPRLRQAAGVLLVINEVTTFDPSALTTPFTMATIDADMKDALGKRPRSSVPAHQAERKLLRRAAPSELGYVPDVELDHDADGHWGA